MVPSELPPAERADLRRRVIRLAWPLVVQNLFVMMMFLVDTFMIGRVGGEAMAAMGVAGPISWMVVSILGSLSVGAVATVARAWGEGDPARCRREAGAVLLLGAAAGVPLAAAGPLLVPLLAELYPVPGAPEVVRMARGYLLFDGASLPFFCLNAAAAGILRGAGQTKPLMAAALAANLLNVFLNGVFIFGHLGAPAMGVAGAGLATGLARAFEAALTVGFLFTPWAAVRLRAAALRGVGRDALARLGRITWPAAVEPIVFHAGWLLFNKAVTLLGVTPLAAHRAALAVESLSYLPGHGIAVAGSALVGQELGARRPDRAGAGFREGARIAVGILSAMGVLFLAAPTPLVRFFVPVSEEAVRLAAVCLAISALEQPFMALAMSYGAALRGAGDTRTPLVVSAIGVWLVRVPLGWLLAFPAGLGLVGIWITMIADWMVRTALFAAVWRRGRWAAIRL